MDKMKFFKILVIVLLLINLLTLAFALAPKVMGPKGQGAKRGIQQHFNFDEAQLEEFEKSRDEIKMKLDDLNPRLTEISKEYYSLENEGEEGGALLDEIAKINAQIYRAHLKHFQDLRTIATPEQRKAIPDFINNLIRTGGQQGPGRREGPGRGQGPGRGGDGPRKR